jgi:hypothetical protein
MNDRPSKHNDSLVHAESKQQRDKNVSEHTAASTATSPCSSVCSDKAQINDLGEDVAIDVDAEKVEDDAAKIEGLDRLAKKLSFQSQPMTAALGRCLSNNDVRLSTSIHSFLSSNSMSSNSALGNVRGGSRRPMANAAFPRQPTKLEKEAKKKEDAEKKMDLFDCLDDLLDEVVDIAEDDDAKHTSMKHSSSVPTLLDDNNNINSSNKAKVPRRQTFSNLQAIGEEAAAGSSGSTFVRHDEIDVSWRGSSDALGGSKNDSATTTNAGGGSKSDSKTGSVAAASVFRNSGSLTPKQQANLEELLNNNNHSQSTAKQPVAPPSSLSTTYVPPERPVQHNMFAGIVSPDEQKKPQQSNSDSKR